MRTRSLVVGLVSAALLAGLAAPATAQCRKQSTRCREAGLTLPTAPPLVTKTYPIADLVVPINMDPASGEPFNEMQTLEGDLMRLITHTVAPKSWASVGGRGALQYYPLGLALVVTQTEENHADIRDLLTALRRLQDVEVAVQLRVVSTSGCVLDRSGMTPCSTGKPVLLDDDQFKEFIGLAMSKMEGTVMQAPKITAFSGQRVRIRVEDEERFLDGMDVVQQDGRAVLLPRYKTVCNGFDFKVRPTVAADRGSVPPGNGPRHDRPAERGKAPVRRPLRAGRGRRPRPGSAQHLRPGWQNGGPVRAPGRRHPGRRGRVPAPAGDAARRHQRVGGAGGHPQRHAAADPAAMT